MERDQVIDILEAIQKNYIRFPVDDRTVDFWEAAMQGMDNKLVVKRLMKHVVENKFPPTIAEIAAYPPKENKQLNKLKQLESDAQDVPQHVKDEFRQALDELVRKKQR